MRVFCECMNTFVFLSVLRVFSERNERVVKYSFKIDELLLFAHPADPKHNQD